MKEIERSLNEIDCPSTYKKIIIATIKDVRLHNNKPVCKDIQSNIFKILEETVKNEDQGSQI